MGLVERLIYYAAAKINLNLEVRGRYPDGYHEIFTTFQAIDLCDTLTFECRESGGITIDCENTALPTDETNLIHRALSRVPAMGGPSVNMRIHVEKNIPIAAGLGGGSANAAAAIRAAQKLYALTVSTDDVWTWAAELGADVPFFLGSAQAEGRGRGDQLTEISLFGDYWLLLIRPKAALSAREVYRALDLTLTKAQPTVSFSRCRDGMVFYALAAEARNDLAVAALRLCPEIQRALLFLEDLGPVAARMSGSGPCVFGIFDVKPDVVRIRQVMPSDTWDVYLCRPLVGVPAVGLAGQIGVNTDRQGVDRGNH